jgi:hypothetical protein
MKQHEAVLEAMKQHGGYATLGQLYQSAPKIPGSEWSGTRDFTANIRRIVQTHKDLFFKIRPGLWGLASERKRVLSLFDDQAVPRRQREYSHYFFQGLVVEIGNLKGFKTFVPNQDRNKPFAQRKLGEVSTLPTMYEFTYTNVVNRAKTIDVSWLNSRKYPDSFFEIEHSTDIYNSLIKFVELQDFRVNFYIIAERKRKSEFESKIEQAAFSSIKSLVKFRDYEFISQLHTKMAELEVLEQALL